MFSKPNHVEDIMKAAGRLAICLTATALFAEAAGGEPKLKEPLRFFEGKTVTQTKVSILFRAPFSSRSLGQGKINPDGSLSFIQMVEEDSRSPFQRSWHIKQVAPGKFSGTMSDAIGPVVVDELGGRYRFRFAMKDSVKIEQWLDPADDGMSATIRTTIRKHGIVVGHSTGAIRRIR